MRVTTGGAITRGPKARAASPCTSRSTPRPAAASNMALGAVIREVAMTLGCHRGQAFSRVVLPLAVKGMVAAGTMAWARALGEFGPVLIFAGATKGRTEVLATSVFLEINIGNLPGAAAISLLMIVIAVVTLLLVRFFVGRGGAI